MHIAIRAAGFSLMTMFVSCGVGAQDLYTHPAGVTMQTTPQASSGQWIKPMPAPVNQQNQ